MKANVTKNGKREHVWDRATVVKQGLTSDEIDGLVSSGQITTVGSGFSRGSVLEYFKKHPWKRREVPQLPWTPENVKNAVRLKEIAAEFGVKSAEAVREFGESGGLTMKKIGTHLYVEKDEFYESMLAERRNT